MSAKRVIPSEMKRLTDIDEVGIERLLSGHAIGDDAELGEVARFFDDVRDAYPEAAADGCEDAHLARMFEAAHLLAETGDPAARSVSNANGPESQAAGLPKLRRTEMIKTLVGSTKFKVIAASLALLVASSGTAFAASQGALPVPVQNVVSSAAAVVGIDVPTADEAIAADAQSAVEADAVDSQDASDTAAGAQGDEQDAVSPADQADEQDAVEVDEQDAVEVDEQDAKQTDAQAADQADEQSTDQADSQATDQVDEKPAAQAPSNPDAETDAPATDGASD